MPIPADQTANSAAVAQLGSKNIGSSATVNKAMARSSRQAVEIQESDIGPKSIPLAVSCTLLAIKMSGE